MSTLQSTTTASKKGTQTITIRAPKDLYRKTKAIAEGLGFSMNSLVIAFFRQVNRDKKISFTLLTENGYTPEFEAELHQSFEESEADIRSGQAKLYTSVDALFTDLNTDD